MGRVCNAPAHRACDPYARNNKPGCNSVGRVSSAPALPRGSSADPIHRLCPASQTRYLLAVQRQKDACDVLSRDLSAGQRPASAKELRALAKRRSCTIVERPRTYIYLSTKIMARRKTSKTKMDTWRLVCAAPNPLLRAEYATPRHTEPATRA